MMLALLVTGPFWRQAAGAAAGAWGPAPGILAGGAGQDSGGTAGAGRLAGGLLAGAGAGQGPGGPGAGPGSQGLAAPPAAPPPGGAGAAGQAGPDSRPPAANPAREGTGQHDAFARAVQQLLYRLERLDPARLEGDPAALELELATPEMPFVNVLVPRPVPAAAPARVPGQAAAAGSSTVDPLGAGTSGAGSAGPGSTGGSPGGGGISGGGGTATGDDGDAAGGATTGGLRPGAAVLLIAFGPRFPETVAHVIATWTDQGTVHVQVLDERERAAPAALQPAGQGAGGAAGVEPGGQAPAPGGQAPPAPGTRGQAPSISQPAGAAQGAGMDGPAPEERRVPPEPPVPRMGPAPGSAPPALLAPGSAGPGFGGWASTGTGERPGPGSGRPAAAEPTPWQAPPAGGGWGLAALFRDGWILPGVDGRPRLVVVTEHHPAGRAPSLRVTLLERSGDQWVPAGFLGRPEPAVAPAVPQGVVAGGPLLFGRPSGGGPQNGWSLLRGGPAGAPGRPQPGAGPEDGAGILIRQVRMAPDGSWLDLTLSTGGSPVLVTRDGPAPGLWEQRWIWTGDAYRLAWSRPVDRALSVLEAFITLVSRGRWAEAAALVRQQDAAVAGAGRELLAQRPLGQGWRVEAVGGNYERGPLVVTRSDGVRITVTFVTEPGPGGRLAVRIAGVVARSPQQAAP
ncbi:hypothetical protein DYI95_010130 [Thermaerobacter sp. PB12/4term]|uniref:hypothetical protein n=1 Tax=Thermaerobacter sp. PB12/4term TaxID=2293838 RepID=UPI001314C4E7|nr:hypothetical protein [Thermaerobacter sp. PB12/4term]QIA27820.1 hypothetical protein DYI95_010130 [Thermaerobacter sp. PB12/4term]